MFKQNVPVNWSAYKNVLCDKAICYFFYFYVWMLIINLHILCHTMSDVSSFDLSVCGSIAEPKLLFKLMHITYIAHSCCVDSCDYVNVYFHFHHFPTKFTCKWYSCLLSYIPSSCYVLENPYKNNSNCQVPL